MSDITKFFNMHVYIGHHSSIKLQIMNMQVQVYKHTYMAQRYGLPSRSIVEQLCVYAHTCKHNLHYSLSGQQFSGLDNGM